MTEFIQALAVAVTLAAIFVGLLCAPVAPSRPGRHSAAHLSPQQKSDAGAWRVGQLPTHRSPYVDALNHVIPGEALSVVRPYIEQSRPRIAEEQAQDLRRWELDMATRGYDVGPTTIHGIHIQPGVRTRVVVA